MTWEQISQKIGEFANTPIVITAFSITYALVVGLVIFSKTSLGKKLFNKALSLATSAKSKADNMEETLSKFRAEKDRQVEEIKKAYDDELAVAVGESLELENLLSKIGEAIPNKKVQTLISDFMESKDERLAKIREIVTSHVDIEGLKTKVQESEERVLSLKEKYEAEAKEAVEAYKAVLSDKEAELDKLLAKAQENALEAEAEGENHVAENTDPNEKEI